MKKLDELLVKFFDYLDLNFSPHTSRLYKSDLLDFIRSQNLTWEKLQHLQKYEIRLYLGKRKTEGLSSTSRLLAACKKFFTFCKLQGEQLSGEVFKLRSHNPKRKIFHVSEPEEIIRKIQDISHKISWIAARDRALCALLYSSGMRISEAIGIKNFKHDQEILIQGKGSKIRSVPIIDYAREQISNYLILRPYHDEYLFTGKNGKKLSYQTAYLITKKLPWQSGTHFFRRSAATHLLRNKMDPESAKKLLGHSQLSTTQKYIIHDCKYLEHIYRKAQKSE